MKIEEIVHRYFEGETSCQEEQELRRFFTEDEVPEHLKMYCPLFICINQEVKELRKVTGEQKLQQKTKERKLRRLFYMVSGVAAGLLLLLSIAGIQRYIYAAPQEYVVIDGKQYTDAELIREQALAAFNDVSFTKEEVLDLMFE